MVDVTEEVANRRGPSEKGGLVPIQNLPLASFIQNLAFVAHHDGTSATYMRRYSVHARKQLHRDLCRHHASLRRKEKFLSSCQHTG